MKAAIRFSFLMTFLVILSACQGADLRNIVNSYNTPGFAMLFGGNESEWAQSIRELPNADFVVSGGSSSTDIPGSSARGGNDGLIARFNATGQVLWQHLYGGSGDDITSLVEPTSDGSFMVLGPTTSQDIAGTTYHGGTEDFWVLKLDANGAVLWQKLYGGNGDDYPQSISGTSDGAFLLAGSTTSTDLPGIANKGGTDGYLAKIDASGTLLWQRTYGGSGDDIIGAVQADGGNFILAGSSRSTDIPGCTNKGGQDFWVMKVDASGTIIWQKMYGGGGTDTGAEAQIVPSGGYYVAGVTDSIDIAGTQHIGMYDLLAIKLDANGDAVWKKIYGGSGPNMDYPVHTVPAEDLVMVGNSESTDIPTTTNHGQGDILITKIDGTGSLQWQKMYGGSLYDWGHRIAERSAVDISFLADRDQVTFLD